MTETKVCNVCNVEKQVSDFYFRKEIGKYRANCKKCKPLLSKAKIIEIANQEKKVCKHCGIEKHRTDFQLAGRGRYTQPYCKLCDAKRKKEFCIRNEERVKQQKKKYYEDNKEIISQKSKERTKAKPKKERIYVKKFSEEELKIRKKEQSKAFRLKHADKIREKKKEYNKRIGNERKRLQQKRMMQNIDFRIKKNLRGRVYVALKRGIKSLGTMELLGCSVEHFKKHFESLFTEGMTWDKYMEGGIHIDHIIPCIAFDLTKEDEQKKCFHYTNLQPLWAIDNLKKGVKHGYVY